MFWAYEGESFGNRVEHLYFPRSGMIIALPVNSATAVNNDDLGTDLVGSVYQTPEKKVPFTQAEKTAKYRPHRSRQRSAAGIGEPDRPPNCCRFGLCRRCGVWMRKSCFGPISTWRSG